MNLCGLGGIGFFIAANPWKEVKKFKRANWEREKGRNRASLIEKSMHNNVEEGSGEKRCIALLQLHFIFSNFFFIVRESTGREGKCN